jgi:hypothetical protein
MDDMGSASATADTGSVIAVGAIRKRGHSNPAWGLIHRR